MIAVIADDLAKKLAVVIKSPRPRMASQPLEQFNGKPEVLARRFNRRIFLGFLTHNPFPYTCLYLMVLLGTLIVKRKSTDWYCFGL